MPSLIKGIDLIYNTISRKIAGDNRYYGITSNITLIKIIAKKQLTNSSYIVKV